MRRLRRAATTLALLCGTACTAEPQPYVVLRIQDPLGMGAKATAIRVTDVSGNTTDFAPTATGFPMTLTITSQRKGSQRVTVDLLANDVAYVRGMVDIDIVASNTKVVDVDLVMICAPLGSADCGQAPILCTTTAECDDGATCNGAETCTGGECVQGIPPCAGPCDEATGCGRTCPSGTDAECADELICNGTERCIAGVCYAGNPLVPTNATDQCAPEICDEVMQTGIAIAADESACGARLICYGGKCVGSDTQPAPCSDLITFEGEPDGAILGGSSSTVALNELTFGSSSGPSGVVLSWRVVVDPVHGHEIQPFSENPTDSLFAFGVASPQRLGSLRIRSADGTNCEIQTSPTTSDTKFVRVIDYATIAFDVTSAISTPTQRVLFYVTCPWSNAGAGNLRLTDVCMVLR